MRYSCESAAAAPRAELVTDLELGRNRVTEEPFSSERYAVVAHKLGN